MADAFCILPWMSVQLNQDGAILPCCRTDETYSYGSTRTSTIERSWNSPSIRELRRRFLAGERPNVCRDCHAIEDGGAKSSRQVFNDQFASSFPRVAETKADGSLEQFEIRYLGLRFSNTCNLRCRSCGPKNSTAWYADAKLLDVEIPQSKIVTPKQTFEELARELEPLIPTLEVVYFAGGEPLLHEDHYRFLDMLIAAGRTDLELQYNTNLTRLGLGDRNVLDYWRKFDSIAISASFDGVGRHAEVIRKGCDWEEIVANFHRLQFLENVKFSVACTVSVLNCFQLTEALDEWVRRKMIRHAGQFEVNVLRDPSYLSLQNLDVNERVTLSDRYDAFLSDREGTYSPELHAGLREALGFILKSMEGFTAKEDRARLAEKTRILDEARGERLADLIPELEKVLR